MGCSTRQPTHIVRQTYDRGREPLRSLRVAWQSLLSRLCCRVTYTQTHHCLVAYFEHGKNPD
jgi:hypothetical protein